jgi:hypothetical protein
MKTVKELIEDRYSNDYAFTELTKNMIMVENKHACDEINTSMINDFHHLGMNISEISFTEISGILIIYFERRI